MGFEDYSVLVCPERASPLWCGNDIAVIDSISNEIQSHWPEIIVDEVEIKHLQYSKQLENEYLAYQSQLGLFQILLHLNVKDQHNVTIPVRFAYCNPRSVYEPFCAFVVWLMEHYKMYCVIMRDLAPEQTNVPREITQVNDVRNALMPSIDYNRRFWQLDAQTEEEAILRPGEAIERFIIPRLVT